MICLTRMNNSKFMLNNDLIEHVEATPDTVITVTSGRSYMVLESPEEIVRRIVSFRRQIHHQPSKLVSINENPNFAGEMQ